MKRKVLLIILTIITCFTAFSCTNDRTKSNNIAEEKNIKNNEILYANDEVVPLADTTITMYDIAEFLKGKKEHYPLSDEFIERYQQSSGGYIDNAKKAGMVVDKQQHEPNQKWHFFESWLYPTIEEGMSWEESAESRVYKKLLCPELLLWIYEACEVSPVKVKAAKEVAEEGKVNKINVSTIAKNMRAVVAWSDLEPAILDFKNNNTDVQYYPVSINTSEDFVVSKLQTEYRAGSEVSFVINVTDSTKQIDRVTANGTTINPTGTTYKFTMPQSEAVINVTLKEKEVVDYPTINLNSTHYNIVYDLGTRKTAKLIETSTEVFNTFVYANEGTGMIMSVSAAEYIYGGGYGGSGEGKWYTGNMLKFGTTSVNGSLVLELNTPVNCIKITGYVSNAAANIQVGDSNSLDWNGGRDGKTTSYTCSDMNVTTKEIVEGNQTSTITIYFESTTSLKIAVINKKPIYITAIELIAANSNSN